MKQETLEEVAEKLKSKELFKESNDREKQFRPYLYGRDERNFINRKIQ